MQRRFVVLFAPVLIALSILAAAMSAAHSWSGTAQAAADPATESIPDIMPVLGLESDVFGRVGWQQLLLPDEPDQPAAVDAPESLSTSFITFAPGQGGDACFEPDGGHTFCFWVESTTNDWNWALDQFMKFPADWQIGGAYDAGPTTCEGEGYFEPFAWSNYLGRPYEIVLDHDRKHANPSDRCYTLICVDAQAGGPADYAPISWYWDSDNYGEPPYHPCSDDGYAPEGYAECDEMINPRASIPACGPHLWEKMVNGAPWQPGSNLTAETYDTFTVVDTFNTNETIVLEEYWTEGQLALVDVFLEPSLPEIQVSIDAEYIIVEVPGGLVESFSVTKVYQVQPCTWSSTVLQETLYVDGQQVDQRPVTIYKQAPNLWTSSSYAAEVNPAETAQITFNFGNSGGYENDVIIRGEFPDGALYQSATPAPDRVDPEGRWAEWNVGDLSSGSSGSINANVAVQSGLVTSTTLEVWNFAFDHTGAVADSNLSTLHVQELWQKWIDNVRWTSGFSMTAETSDAFTVIDTFVTDQSIVLEEYWTEGQLALVDVYVEPDLPEIGVYIDTEYIIVEVPGGLVESVSVTKVYQLQPCTWTSTVLHEDLYVGGQLAEQRPVTIHKQPPDLRLGGAAKTQVEPGTVASYTLSYVNFGGYENDVSVRSDFPAEASFSHAMPAPDRTDASGKWAEWDLGDLAGLDFGNLAVYFDVQPGLPNFTQFDILSHIYDHVGQPADGVTMTFEITGALPLWQKWVDDQPWSDNFSRTLETYDNFQVVDTFNTFLGLTHQETWDPAHLQLLEVAVLPSGVAEPQVEPGSVTITFPEGDPESIEVVKLFHVRPCTWTETTLVEELRFGEELIEQRPVTITKSAPDLRLGGAAKTQVEPGTVASYTLSYVNFGGYENDVSVRSDFPAEASFSHAMPAPDRTDPAGQWAEWDLGDLAGNDFGNLAVYFDVKPGLSNFTQFDILSHIYDHVGQPADGVTMTFEITGALPLWEKRIADQPWQTGFVHQAETYDNFEVVDTFNTLLGLTHQETWDPEQLQLLEVAVWPSGVAEPQVEPGSVTITFPEGDPESIEVVKLLHVRPCTWTETSLVEELRFGEELIERRPVTITKSAPDLRLGGAAKIQVEPGTVASYTLSYVNFGGYENDVSVRSDFPAEASFSHAMPAPDRTDASGKWAEWDLGDLTGLDFGNLAVYFEVQSGLPNFMQFDILSHIYDHVDHPADGVTMTFEITGALPLWQKWVDDQPWTDNFSRTLETYDNFQVVDTFNTFLGLTLQETWDPEQLQLLEVAVWPSGVAEPQVEPGSVTITFPVGDPESIEVVKLFHVRPCTWTETTLVEELRFGEEMIERRPVTITKSAPDLGLGGAAKTQVEPGTVASYTLNYVNFGGYENDVSVRSDFPAEASFSHALPAPDRTDPSGKWAEWDLGDLAGLDFGNLAVYFDVKPGLPNHTQFDILSHIYDHVNQPAAALTMSFEIAAAQPLWEKWVDNRPWTPGISQTLETTDTFAVVDTFNTTEPFVLEEYWTEGQLALIDVIVEPDLPEIGVFIDTEYMIVEVPGDLVESLTVTKLFQVQPCTWTNTLLEEELYLSGELVAQRPVTVNKRQPLLAIDASYLSRVDPGAVTSFTIEYGNNGGYENDVTVAVAFPPDATFESAAPPPTSQNAGEGTAVWEVGDLGNDEGATIVITVTLAAEPTSSPVLITAAVNDHMGQAAAEIEISYLVLVPKAYVPAIMRDVGIDGPAAGYAQTQTTSPAAYTPASAARLPIIDDSRPALLPGPPRPTTDRLRGLKKARRGNAIDV